MKRGGFRSLSKKLVATLVGAAAGAALMAAPASAAFGGLNGKVVFSSYRDGNLEIYSMNPDGSSQTNLTNSPADDSLPAVSPDGNKIVFSSFQDANYELFMMNVDGSGLVRVTTNSSSDFMPGWSADGRVVFASDRDGDYDVWVMNADGTGVANLSNNSGHDLFPAWSPDGSRIAFVSTVTSGGFELHSMAADGSSQVRLAALPASSPDWAPDGSKIVFESSGEILVVGSDGSGIANRTNNGDYDLSPAWSADGSRIFFSSSRDGDFELYSMNPDGSAPTRLTSVSGPDWQPDVQPVVAGGDLAVDLAVGGPVARMSGAKTVSVVLENLGAEPVSVGSVGVSVSVNGGSPIVAEALSGVPDKPIAPGKSVRMNFRWSFEKGSVNRGDLVVFTASAVPASPDSDPSNNSDSETVEVR